jgi:hypothetical protein
VTGAISFLIRYTDVDHSRIDGTAPKCSLHLRQIHVPTHHVRGEGVLQNVRMARMVRQACLTSYLAKYPDQQGPVLDSVQVE